MRCVREATMTELLLLATIFLVSYLVFRAVAPRWAAWVKSHKTRMRKEVVTWAMSTYGWDRTRARNWVNAKFTFYTDGAECQGGLNLRNKKTVHHLPRCLVRIIGNLDIRGTGVKHPPKVAVLGRLRADGALRVAGNSSHLWRGRRCRTHRRVGRR